MEPSAGPVPKGPGLICVPGVGDLEAGLRLDLTRGTADAKPSISFSTTSPRHGVDRADYSLTKAGGRALKEQTERWRRRAGLVDKLLVQER